jgi:hypothetical protein
VSPTCARGLARLSATSAVGPSARRVTKTPPSSFSGGSVEQHPEHPESQPESQPAPAVPAKNKPWTKPTLTKNGTAADLTQGNPTQGPDALLLGST